LRRFLFLPFIAVSVIGGLALAQAFLPTRRPTPNLQKATDALPSGTALCDAGMSLTSIQGYTPCVRSTTPGLLLDGGVLEAYWIDPGNTDGGACGTLSGVPSLNATIPARSGLQDFCGDDVETIMYYGRVYYRARGFALSNGSVGDDGGTNLSVSITGRVAPR